MILRLVGSKLGRNLVPPWAVERLSAVLALPQDNGALGRPDVGVPISRTPAPFPGLKPWRQSMEHGRCGLIPSVD
jgi:hypothetical protein